MLHCRWKWCKVFLILYFIDLSLLHAVKCKFESGFLILGSPFFKNRRISVLRTWPWPNSEFVGVGSRFKSQVPFLRRFNGLWSQVTTSYNASCFGSYWKLCVSDPESTILICFMFNTTLHIYWSCLIRAMASKFLSAKLNKAE